jgi:hypothetical protein
MLEEAKLLPYSGAWARKLNEKVDQKEVKE